MQAPDGRILLPACRAARLSSAASVGCRAPSKSPSRWDGAQDPSRPCVKNHHSLVLRAESAVDKYAWLARLRHASELAPGPRPHPRGSTDALRAAASGGLERPSATPSRASNVRPCWPCECGVIAADHV